MLKIIKYTIFVFLIFNLQNTNTADNQSINKLNEEFLQAVIDSAPIQIIQKLIAAGADVNYNKQGINISENDVDNINTLTRRCNPALTYAIINENKVLIEMLLKAKANTFYKDMDGNTPFELALSRIKDADLISFLGCISILHIFNS